MPIEIERKFLLVNTDWREQVTSSYRIRQGYMGEIDKASVRIRVQGDKANINIKSATLSMRRMEYEYEIPLIEAQEMLDQLCKQPQVDKTRFIVEQGKFKWEIDEFYGENEGLLVAEIELDDENETFDKPDWVGEEVTEDPRYYNVNLIKHPFKNW
ncbi:MAG: adenylate cyclase [endosymbiont of Galathealinum brachiosum]|uniref:Adenylate cyclase n=1 Tax=endosymbiont of Galathealinum brachiosum TaxID=2200906 RepID=A0A370DMG9_9GAMM|nr:MAG: adenylate cyclase [endosymbiont of Galathealinum brachiosum]